MKRKFLTGPFLLTAFLSFGIQGNAQNIAFEYDGTGARLSRRIVTLKLSSQAVETTQDSLIQEEGITDVLEECAITAFPNPTKGEITVVISGGEEDKAGQISVCDQWGKLIEQQGIMGNGEMQFDLSGRPAGLYFLIFTRGKDRLDYKIIKTE
ncbi:MAG: T9SS type A sorting domain-containing protein [Bacteroidaceae bacterium]|jgi:hypothetical protein